MKHFTNWLRDSSRINHPGSLCAISGVAIVVFAYGLIWHNPSLVGGGAVAICLAVRSYGEQAQRRKLASELRQNAGRRTTDPLTPAVVHHDDTPRLSDGQEPVLPYHERKLLDPEVKNDPDNLVDELIASERYALLLRPEMQFHLDQDQIVRAVRRLDEQMGLVPAGNVLLGPLAENSGSNEGGATFGSRGAERFLAHIEPVYLDRFAVTNEQFQTFLDAGGYEKLEYWDEEALPALLDFVDQTGHPGPRYWYDGRYCSGDARKPVVGISWYEASAYARWVGKRLLTDAQWTKAGAWPIESAPGRVAQRRYPWGESFESRRARLWGTDIKAPVEVDQYPSGMSVGGIYQLIGNVWEWSASSLATSCDPSLYVPDVLKSIRGGAFDTYFENHATCHYQSGEQPLARRRNIGFRLALPMVDLEATAAEAIDPSATAEPDLADEQLQESTTFVAKA